MAGDREARKPRSPGWAVPLAVLFCAAAAASAQPAAADDRSCVSLRVSSTTTGLLCVSPGGRPRAAAKVFAGYLCRDERAHPADFAATHDGASFAAHYGTRRANALARCVAQKATTAGGLLTAMGAASSSSCFDHRPPGATTLKTRTKTFAVYFVRGHC